MKKLGLLGAVLLIVLIGFTSFAQVTRDVVAEDQTVITAQNNVIVGAGATAYTEAFTLAGQDAFSWYSYPWNLSITASVPTTGTIKAVVYWQGSFSKASGFTNLDTLKVDADSVLSSTAYVVSTDISNKKYPWYRYAYTTAASSADSVTVVTKAYNPMLNKYLRP